MRHKSQMETYKLLLIIILILNGGNSYLSVVHVHISKTILCLMNYSATVHLDTDSRGECWINDSMEIVIKIHNYI